MCLSHTGLPSARQTGGWCRCCRQLAIRPTLTSLCAGQLPWPAPAPSPAPARWKGKGKCERSSKAKWDVGGGTDCTAPLSVELQGAVRRVCSVLGEKGTTHWPFGAVITSLPCRGPLQPVALRLLESFTWTYSAVEARPPSVAPAAAIPGALAVAKASKGVVRRARAAAVRKGIQLRRCPRVHSNQCHVRRRHSSGEQQHATRHHGGVGSGACRR